MGISQLELSNECIQQVGELLRSEVPEPVSCLYSSRILPFDTTAETITLASSIKSQKLDESKFQDLHAFISTRTGMLEGLSVDGVDVLASRKEEKKSSFNTMLFRAPTDNDRFGYLSRWSDVGMDKPMKLVPLSADALEFFESKTSDISNGGKIQTFDFEYTRIKTLTDNDECKVICCWEEEGHVENPEILFVLKAVQDFDRDNSKKYCAIPVFSQMQEEYIHKLCATLILSHRSILIPFDTTNKSNDMKIDGDFDTLYNFKDTRCLDSSVAVLLWKRPIMMCTTIKLAGVSSGSPFGDIFWNKRRNNTAQMLENAPNSSVETPKVFWMIIYTLTNNGALRIDLCADCSKLPTFIPRLGLQLSLKKASLVIINSSSI